MSKSKKPRDLTQEVIPAHIDQSNRTLVIDGDSIPFTISWGLKNLQNLPSDYMFVVNATDEFMDTMMKQAGCEKYVGFLGGVHPTFRHMMCNTYKANRGQTKPEWFQEWGTIVRHRLIYKWKFHCVEGIEAEDAAGIVQKHLGYDKTVLAHIDKDLDQFPGIHYNFNTSRKYFLHWHVAQRNLYYLMLVGDTIDNLPGCPGIGPKKAEAILFNGDIHSNPTAADEAWKEGVVKAYISRYGPAEGPVKMLESYNLTKVLEDPDTNGFKFPVEQYPPIEYKPGQSSATQAGNLNSSRNHAPVQNLFE
jgi:5'-3' exonuclease